MRKAGDHNLAFEHAALSQHAAVARFLAEVSYAMGADFLASGWKGTHLVNVLARKGDEAANVLGMLLEMRLV